MLAVAQYAFVGLVLLLLSASYLAWNDLIRKLARRESPLAYESRPALRLADLDSVIAWLGFVPEKFGWDVRCGVIAFLISAAPVYAIQALLAYWIPYEHPLIDELQQKQDPATIFRVFMAAVVIAPLFEELVFRVFLQGTLEAIQRRHSGGLGSLSRRAAPIVTSSLAFALAHANQGPAPVPLFFFALVLGYLYHQTHRAVPSIVAHACLNAVSLVMFWLAIRAS